MNRYDHLAVIKRYFRTNEVKPLLKIVTPITNKQTNVIKKTTEDKFIKVAFDGRDDEQFQFVYVQKFETNLINISERSFAMQFDSS